MRKLSRIDVKKTLDKVDTSMENESVNGHPEGEESPPAWNAVSSDLKEYSI